MAGRKQRLSNDANNSALHKASRKRSLSNDTDNTDFYKNSIKQSLSNDADNSAHYKEWDDTICPICMDHPHNAVLLMCNSHDKGCRSYICDTSYRHSNCLDRYKKLTAESNSPASSPRLLPRNQDISIGPDRNSGFRNTRGSSEVHVHNTIRNNAVTEMPHGLGENRIHAGSSPIDMEHDYLESGGYEILERDNPALPDYRNIRESRSSLRCPLCCGSVLGWKVVEEARNYLNSKIRSCSRESCSFTGNYRELRKHARRIHPAARPSDVDPSREHAWQHLQNQRAYGDILSAIQTAMPGAIVRGDYVIEDDDSQSDEMEEGSSESNIAMWSTFFLFHFLSSAAEPFSELRYERSRASSARQRRSTGTSSVNRYLWGQNLLGAHDDDDDILNFSEDDHMNGDSSSTRRQRRRFS